MFAKMVRLDTSLLLLAALVLPSGAVRVQYRQMLDLYEHTLLDGQNGPDLVELAQTQDACYTGAWILYQDPKYAKGRISSDNPVRVLSGVGQCRPLDFDVSSARFAGSPESMNRETLNLYEGPKFQGATKLYLEDDAVLSPGGYISARSAAITGCDPWTLYLYDNYKGESTCLYPPETQSCHPAFYNETRFEEALDGQPMRFRSARKGCFSDSVMKL